MGGSKEWGLCFIMSVDGKFLKSLQIVGRGVLTLLFKEDPLYCLPPFSNFVKSLLPQLRCHLQSPPSLFFLLCIIWIYTCRALVSEYQKDLNVCFMQQGINFTELWQMWFFYWCSDLILHTQTHTAHSAASRLTNLYVLTATTLITLND